MPGPAAILREIHRFRRHAKDLQNEIDRGPRALKTQQAKTAKQEENLREAQESLKRLKVAIHEKEVTLRSKNQQISKHQQQLNEATSKKEYDALQVEIASEKKACQHLEDEILTDMTTSEERAAQIPELEQAVRQAKEDVVRFEASNQARLADLTGQMNQTLQTIQEIETTLPPDILAQYARMTSARGEDALASMSGRTCSACYTDITAQNYNELLQEQFVVCKSCGRILYLPPA